MRQYTALALSAALIAVWATSSHAAITGIPSGTPESVVGGVIGGQIPNPNNVEFYGGQLMIGSSQPHGHQDANSSGGASLWWFKFVSDGVSDVIMDTFGSTATFSFGGFGGSPGTELAIFDSSGDLVLNQSRVRNDPFSEPGNVAPNPNGFDADLPPIGNQAFNTPHDPLDPIARGGTNGAANNEILAIGPAPGYAVTLGPADSPIIWRNNVRATSQIAFVQNPAPNPLWDPAHPDHDPDADWDQYPILPAGEYFIAITGGARWSGFAPDMIDQTKQVGDIVQNGNPATPDALIPDDGAGNSVPFGFTSIHPNSGTMILNLRNPGDFDSNTITNATDIDILFDRVAALAGQGLDPGTGVTLDGLPLTFVESTWEPETDLNATDMVLDLTGNSRIDLGDVTMLVQNILGSAFGDANLDGVVDGTDQALVEGNLNTPGGWATGDFNGDGMVNQADLDILLANIPLLDGDLNGDGFVGVDDLNIVLLNWNQNVTPGDLGAGDATGEGFVGVDDLNVILVNWNNGTPPPPGGAGPAIPEPAMAALFTVGIGLIVTRRNRRCEVQSV